MVTVCRVSRRSNLLPDDVPAHWSVYLGVNDADAALATIVELGGSILRAAEDTPYGRLATAADPAGAQFTLVAATATMPTRDST
ncbi:MAG: VOC family protein [Sciscionella sp.]